MDKKMKLKVDLFLKELKQSKGFATKKKIIKNLSKKIKITDREGRIIIIKLKEMGYFIFSCDKGIKLTKNRKEQVMALDYMRTQRNGLNYNIILLENIYNSNKKSKYESK